MARIRTVKPEWLDDEKLASLDSDSRVLSIALLLLADDYGSGRASPKYIASRAFTYSRDPRESFARPSERSLECLVTLSDVGYLKLYKVEGEVYYIITHWKRHQKVDKPGKVRNPEYKQDLEISSREFRETFAEHSRDHREIPSTDLGPRTIGPRISDCKSDLNMSGSAHARVENTRSLTPTEQAPLWLKVAGIYGRSYERLTGNAWMSHARYEQEFRDIATWCEAQARIDASGPLQVAEDLVGRFFAEDWVAGKGYPVKALANNPGKYWSINVDGVTKPRYMVDDSVHVFIGNVFAKEHRPSEDHVLIQLTPKLDEWWWVHAETNEKTKSEFSTKQILKAYEDYTSAHQPAEVEHEWLRY